MSYVTLSSDEIHQRTVLQVVVDVSPQWTLEYNVLSRSDLTSQKGKWFRSHLPAQRGQETLQGYDRFNPLFAHRDSDREVRKPHIQPHMLKQAPARPRSQSTPVTLRGRVTTHTIH